MPSAIDAVVFNLKNRGGSYLMGITDERDLVGDVPTRLVGKIKDAMDELMGKFAEWRVVAKAGDGEGPSEFAQAGKTGL
jgi:hypothetical protein